MQVFKDTILTVILVGIFVTTTYAQRCSIYNYTIYYGAKQVSKNLFDSANTNKQEAGIKGIIALYQLGKIDTLNLFFLQFKNFVQQNSISDKVNFYKKNEYLFKGFYFTQSNSGEVIGYNIVDKNTLASKNIFLKIIGFLSHSNVDIIKKIHNADGLFKMQFEFLRKENEQKVVHLNQIEKLQEVNSNIIKKHFNYNADGKYFYSVGKLDSIKLCVEKETKLNFKLLSRTTDTFSLVLKNKETGFLPLKKQIEMEEVSKLHEKIQSEQLLQYANSLKMTPIEECVLSLSHIDTITNEKTINILTEAICNYVHFKKDTQQVFEKLFLQSNPDSKNFDVLKVAIMNLKNPRFNDVFLNFFKHANFSILAFSKCLPNLSFMNAPSDEVFEILFKLLSKKDFNEELKEQILLAISNLIYERNKVQIDYNYFERLDKYIKRNNINTFLAIAVYGNTGNDLNILNYYDSKKKNDIFLESAALYALRFVKNEDAVKIYLNYINSSNEVLIFKSLSNAFLVANPNNEIINAIKRRILLNNLSEENETILIKTLYSWSFFAKKAIETIYFLNKNTNHQSIKNTTAKYIKNFEQ